MKPIKIPGLDERVYSLIGPYAMSAKFIKDNGNPIITSELHTWYVCFDEDERLSCFCSVKFSNSVKNMQIGNLFILSGGKKSFNTLIKQIIKDTAKEKGLGLRAYANNKNKDDFMKMGFEMLSEGVNWHNLKYNDERLRSSK